MNPVTIPATVDELPQVGFWELDEAVFLLLGLVVGTLTGAMFTGAIIGIVLASLFSKYKANKNRGMLFHTMYWYGMIPLKGMWCDNSFKRYWTN